ncbi:pectate lyase [Adhaeribacter aerolatus]|uniref:Pectate lyase n=2 Tax=Adhaeribacter aerolatus TaxID=670289 RepID=A0A512B0A4_9BACT|nr:pectate lyase [Adhaeribacter aerolatus]
MLLYQRANGGWPQYKGNATDYRKKITVAQKAQLLIDKTLPDATIDDKSTTYEINYLVKAHAQTRNPEYLKAAEKGINYLLQAQYPNGGWSQSYPDTSSYHKHITFNDGAMTDALGVLKSTAEKIDGYSAVDKKIAAKAKTAVAKGVQCILKAQYYQNGVLTAWGAQHHYKTLQPTSARKFELASLSSSESVAVLEFLMSIPNPSPEIKQAVRAAVAWLDKVKITGITTQRITDATQPTGREVKVLENPQAVSWARFYELETNKPIFTGRDGIKRYTLAEIENERRVGYSWYNTRPAKLLSTDYPAWVKKWEK